MPDNHAEATPPDRAPESTPSSEEYPLSIRCRPLLKSVYIDKTVLDIIREKDTLQDQLKGVLYGDYRLAGAYEGEDGLKYIALRPYEPPPRGLIG